MPGESASPDEINAAEARLGAMPLDYRAFLGDFGWMELGHREVFGLGDGVPAYLNVVDMTLSERADAGVPDEVIVIANDGSGNLVCLDLLSGRVVTWWHESRSTEATAPDFTSWLVSLLPS